MNKTTIKEKKKKKHNIHLHILSKVIFKKTNHVSRENMWNIMRKSISPSTVNNMKPQINNYVTTLITFFRNMRDNKFIPPLTTPMFVVYFSGKGKCGCGTMLVL